jgi:hypothetical protein
MAEPDPRWRLHASPNPKERSFSVIVSQDKISEFKDDFDDYDAESSYEDFPLIADPDLSKADQYGDFLYTQQNDFAPGWLEFWFAPWKTEAEAKIPYHSEWSKFGNHRWHPILKNLVILEDTAFPRSTNIIQNNQQGFATGPSYTDQYIYIPDANEGSRFYTEEFTSPRPFVIGRYLVPLPTGIQYTMGDLRGSFSECLHDDIEIPAARTSNAIYLGGAVYSASGYASGQRFPRTNFKTWLPYVVYDEQQLQNGVYYRKRIRVFPPPLPRAIRRA